MTSAEGLRERKKRLMRQQLSDTAARLFLEHGFAGVPVAAVAEACGVSVKTVFNYFPTKEALLLDRLEETTATLRSAIADPAVPPVDAVLRVLAAELDGLTGSLGAAGDRAGAVALHRRFGELIRTTPSLRAHRNDMVDRFVTVAAAALAVRSGAEPDDPEPLVTAAALVGLWRVQYAALDRHLRDDADLAAVRDAVIADVRRAAGLVRSGIGSFAR
jgi:AcrR family transcriptional regulator